MFKEGDRIWYYNRLYNEVYRGTVRSASDKVVRFSDDFVADIKDCFSNKDEAKLELVKRCIALERHELAEMVGHMKNITDNIKRLEKRKDKLERRLR